MPAACSPSLLSRAVHSFILLEDFQHGTLFLSTSKPGEPPCSFRMAAFSSPSLWLFRRASYYSGPKCVEWGPPPCTDVLFEAHKKVQSGSKSGAWAAEKVAINTCAEAAPKRTDSSSPRPSSVVTLCVLHLLTEPGSWPLEISSLFYCPPVGTRFLLSPHCA